MKRIVSSAIVCGALCVSHFADAVSAFEIVRHGELRTQIVLPADAPPTSREAAEELVHYIEKMSGVVVPIVDTVESPPTHGLIWIGLQPGVREAFPSVDLSFSYPEGIRIVTDGNHLFIGGRDVWDNGVSRESGTANAVYMFIQRYLGVRWFWPGPLGEDVPTQSSIVVPITDYRFAPTFRQRRMHRLGLYGYRGYGAHEKLAEITGQSLQDIRRGTGQKRAAAIDWYRRQRIWHDSFEVNTNHAFRRWWEDYHETHPEYFAEQFREAALSGEPLRQPDRVKLCVSNPAVHQRWLDNAETELRKNPHQVMVSATPNDGGGFCYCERCAAWDHPATDAITDRMARFWNILARGLRERFPDREVHVGALAYSAYRSPPIGIRLEDNVTIGYVGHMPVTGSEIRTREREDWLEWAAQATQIVYRPNLFHYSGGMLGLPALAMEHTVEDFRFLVANKCVGLNIDSVHEHWGVMAPQYYLMNQLAWDPWQDVDELMTDFYQRAFGPAAQYIARYFSEMEQIHYRILEEMPMSSSFRYEATDMFQREFSLQRMEEARQLLDQASRSVADSDQSFRGRVAFVYAGFEFVDLQIRIIRAMARVRESEGRDPLIVQEATALCELRDQFFRETLGSFVISHTHYLSYVEWRTMHDYMGPP